VQERRQQGGRRCYQGRPRRADRGAPVKIPPQHRRAGPPRHQAGDEADAQLQIIPLRRLLLAGIELMQMIRKGQLAIDGANAMSSAVQFYALAEQVRPV
jgi:hypothetical protein